MAIAQDGPRPLSQKATEMSSPPIADRSTAPTGISPPSQGWTHPKMDRSPTMGWPAKDSQQFEWAKVTLRSCDSGKQARLTSLADVHKSKLKGLRSSAPPHVDLGVNTTTHTLSAALPSAVKASTKSNGTLTAWSCTSYIDILVARRLLESVGSRGQVDRGQTWEPPKQRTPEFGLCDIDASRCLPRISPCHVPTFRMQGRFRLRRSSQLLGGITCIVS